MSCPPLERVVAWALDELRREEADAFEEHYFGCDRCFKRAERVHRLIAELDASLPPLLTHGRRSELAARHPHMPVVNVAPGEHAHIQLDDSSPVGIWVMHAPLADAKRVDFEARDPAGTLLFSHEDVPFDAERGEVVLACQVHYRALPVTKLMRVRVVATDASGQRRATEYALDHEFESV